MSISKLARFLNGLPREVELDKSTLHVDALDVGAADPASLTKAMVTLLDTIKTTGIPAANVSVGAKKAVLESKLAAFRVGVLNFDASSDTTSSDVTTAVSAVATTNTVVAGAGVSEVDEKGIFVGTVSGAADIGKVLIRVTGTDNGVDDGTGDEIYGVLTEASGAYTLEYKKSNGDAYTITAEDAAAGIDFYFVEVMDLYSFGVDRLLMPAISGVVDATSASAIVAERNARMAADSSLQDNIDAERDARIAEDCTLQMAIEDEEDARELADSTLQANIDAEALARSLADSSLQAQLDELNVSVVDREYVAGASIAVGDVVIHSTMVAGEVIKANAEAIFTCESVAGVALADASDLESVMVRTFGIATVNQDAPFELGKRVYVSAATAGNATKTAPSDAANVVYLLGGATDIDEVFVNSNLEYIVYSE